MTDYIDRSALQDAINKKKDTVNKEKSGVEDQRYIEGFNNAILRVKSMVENFPSADVVLVQHNNLPDEAGKCILRYGKWIDPGLRNWRCSECGCIIREIKNVDGYRDDLPNYCPHCGAKMTNSGKYSKGR